MKSGGLSIRTRALLAPCVFSAVIVLVALLPACGRRAAAPPNTNWASHGSDAGNTRYAPLDQINAENVHELEIAWRWESIETEAVVNGRRLTGGPFKPTPLVVDGLMYVVTSIGQVAALNPGTGELVWKFDTESYLAGRPANLGYQHRGVSYWSDGVESRVFVASHDLKLWALDAKTGRPAPGFANGGPVDLSASLGRPIAKRLITHTSPVGIAGNTIVVGSVIADGATTREMPPGHVRGFDARTGELKWIFHTIPQAGEFGVDTWENDSWKFTGNTNVWTMFAVDEELGYVYMPVSSPTSDLFGGFRLGDNLFGDSLVCVDAETGERVWHFQTIHHPLWDYDLPPPPILVDLIVDGRPVKAVVQVSKQAFCYVFDRVTGEPVWPIEERPVPPSEVPGERAAPTQPFPTRPAPFELQGVTKDDLIDFTPELRAEAVELLKPFRLGGLYTPPHHMGGTISSPSANGAINWLGAACDPETGVLYVPSSRTLGYWGVMSSDPNRSNLPFVSLVTTPLELRLDAFHGLPILKPPYARVTAIDLNSGEHLWSTVHGDGPRDHPMLAHLDLPPLGHVGDSTAGPLLTKSLFFVAVPAATHGSEMDKTPRLSVFEKKSGAFLGAIALPSDPHGNPMTYMHEGKQYIALAVGGRPQFAGAANRGERQVAEIIALSLPD